MIVQGDYFIMIRYLITTINVYDILRHSSGTEILNCLEKYCWFEFVLDGDRTEVEG